MVLPNESGGASFDLRNGDIISGAIINEGGTVNFYDGGINVVSTTHAGRGLFGGVFTDHVQATAKDVTITLAGGTVGNVFGGGWAQYGGKSTVENVTITIEAGADGTGSTVYGGGAHAVGEAAGTTVAGNVNINVTQNTTFKSIFAGGQCEGDSVANTAITVRGAYGDFTTNLFGQGYQNAGTVIGASDLNLNDFTGAVTGYVGGFNEIILAGTATAVDFTATNWYGADSMALVLDLAGRDGEAGFMAALGDNTGLLDRTVGISLGAKAKEQAELNVFTAVDLDLTFDIFDGKKTHSLAAGEAISEGDYAGWGIKKDKYGEAGLFSYTFSNLAD